MVVVTLSPGVSVKFVHRFRCQRDSKRKASDEGPRGGRQTGESVAHARPGGDDVVNEDDCGGIADLRVRTTSQSDTPTARIPTVACGEGFLGADAARCQCVDDGRGMVVGNECGCECIGDDGGWGESSGAGCCSA